MSRINISPRDHLWYNNFEQQLIINSPNLSSYEEAKIKSPATELGNIGEGTWVMIGECWGTTQ